MFDNNNNNKQFFLTDNGPDINCAFSTINTVMLYDINTFKSSITANVFSLLHVNIRSPTRNIENLSIFNKLFNMDLGGKWGQNGVNIGCWYG